MTEISDLVELLLTYIFILRTMKAGWTVKVLNNKTFEFRKPKKLVSSKMKHAKHFISTFGG